MAAISEKILWPIVAIFIFGVLAGFYIDDRRRLAQEGGSPKEHGGNAAEQKEHGGKAAEHAGQATTKTPASTAQSQPASASNSSSHSASSGQSSQSSQTSTATSMDINEYLSKLSSENSAQLEANAAQHQGFSGGIEEYLNGAKVKVSQTTPSNNNAQTNNNQANGATSMSIDEYHTKTSGSSTSQQQNSSGSAYNGDMDGYLAKYGSGTQTPMKKQSAAPFNKKEHMGFHGSYEDYAKKYN